jgi:hypothetical protein
VMNSLEELARWLRPLGWETNEPLNCQPCLYKLGESSPIQPDPTLSRIEGGTDWC